MKPLHGDLKFGFLSHSDLVADDNRDSKRLVAGINSLTVEARITQLPAPQAIDRSQVKLTTQYLDSHLKISGLSFFPVLGVDGAWPHTPGGQDSTH
jgi:hypothetical protein